MKKVLFLNPSCLIKYGIRWGFEKLNWETHILHGDDFIAGKSTQFQVNTINKHIEQYKIDLVFVEFMAGLDYQAIYNLCKSKGVSFYVWLIEDVPSYTAFGSSVIDYTDYVFTTCIELIPFYKSKHNRDSKLLTFGVNPEFHKPSNPNKNLYKSDIVAIGNNYPSRYDKMKWFLQTLINHKYDINVYGGACWTENNRGFNIFNHKEIYKGYLSYEELPVIYNTCKIALGMNCNSESSTQMSMRMYEFLGCTDNALMLSFYTKSQENVFGDRLYLPKNEQETIDMANEILNIKEEHRVQKAKNNREWVYKNHSYIDRAKIVIDTFEGR